MGDELTVFLRHMERTVVFLHTVRGPHALVAHRWAEHLDGDRRSLWLLALGLEDYGREDVPPPGEGEL